MTVLPTIVVLDDERPQLLAVRATLSRIGQIKEFSDPEVALGFLKEHRVEVAIVDVHMPRYSLNGIDFIRSVREFDADLSIIVRTADDSSELADQSIEVRAFRRAVKHKTSPSQLQQLVTDAAAETIARRQTSLNAAETSGVKTQLAVTLGSIEDEATVAEGYRTLFQTITNQLTAIAGTTELLDRELVDTGTPLVRMLAAKNRQLVERLVHDVANFLNAPLAELTRAESSVEHTSANGTLEALHRRVAADARWAADPKQFKVVYLVQDFFVAVTALKLITALRHLVEYCLLRAAEGTSVVLSARYIDQAIPLVSGGLVFNLNARSAAISRVGFSLTANLGATTLEDIRRAVESPSEDLRTANLQMIGLALGDSQVAATVNRDPRGVTTFEIYIPVAH